MQFSLNDVVTLLLRQESKHGWSTAKVEDVLSPSSAASGTTFAFDKAPKS
jgi:hypothetical protein